LHRLRSLFRLRYILGQTILDEHAARDLNPQKAAHLHDAVNDLRILIERLETDLNEHQHQQHHTSATVGGEQRVSQSRSRENATTQQMERRV
jgi:hypothetical protein